MFGYIRPMQGELKVFELERFKACYCGLCHALRNKYGPSARLVLNYELVLLAMLLWDAKEKPVFNCKRCIASPFRKREYCAGNESLDKCAGYNLILAWWRLQDTIADERIIKSLPHRIVSVLISRSYKKAARDLPVFNETVREQIVKLTEYEKNEGSSLDNAADRFAQILSAAAPISGQDPTHRPMRELMYHLGRWIYIIDACDDYKEDIKDGRYNPVVSRFPPESGSIPSDAFTRLKATIDHSNDLVCLAFELLPENPWTDVVRNMIYLGMPFACESVMKGSWPPRRKTKRKNGII